MVGLDRRKFEFSDESIDLVDDQKGAKVGKMSLTEDSDGLEMHKRVRERHWNRS